MKSRLTKYEAQLLCASVFNFSFNICNIQRLLIAPDAVRFTFLTKANKWKQTNKNKYESSVQHN